VLDPANLNNSRDLKESLSLIKRLIGRPRTIAAHPGGVIFGEPPLGDFLPFERAPKGVAVMQYNYSDISGLGIMKLDLLGNAGLSEIKESLELAGNDHPERLEDIPAEDPRTLSLIDHADTVGCFQLESPAIRSLLAKIPIRNQDDIVSAIALIRPGAAADNAKSTFIRRARGEESDHMLEPSVSDRPAGTYGLILFEEDLMVLLGRLGGLDMGEADRFRSAIIESGGDPKTLSLLKREFLGKARVNGKFNEFSDLRISQAWDAAARFAEFFICLLRHNPLKIKRFGLRGTRLYAINTPNSDGFRTKFRHTFS